MTPFINDIDASFKLKSPISYTAIEYVDLSWTKSDVLILKQKRIYGLLLFFEKPLTNKAINCCR